MIDIPDGYFKDYKGLFHYFIPIKIYNVMVQIRKKTLRGDVNIDDICSPMEQLYLSEIFDKKVITQESFTKHE
jgi:hypothetical protein